MSSSQTTKRMIHLVQVPGEKPKAFGSRWLAEDYVSRFCTSGATVEEIILVEERPRSSEERTLDEYGYENRPKFDPSDYDC